MTEGMNTRGKVVRAVNIQKYPARFALQGVNIIVPKKRKAFLYYGHTKG